MNCSTPGLPVCHQPPEFTQTHVHQVGDAIQPSHPLSSPSPPAPNPSQHHSLFQWVNPSHEVAKVLGFQLQHHSLKTPRADLLAVQGTLKSLLQHHSSKASILWCLDFFTVQLSHPYMTTGKTIALTRWTFGGKVMSLLFDMLSRLVITFLPRNIQDWFPLGGTGWVSLQSKRLSRVFSNTTVQTHQFFGIQFSLSIQTALRQERKKAHNVPWCSGWSYMRTCCEILTVRSMLESCQ